MQQIRDLNTSIFMHLDFVMRIFILFFDGSVVSIGNS